MKTYMRWLTAGTMIAAAGLAPLAHAQPAKKDTPITLNPEITRRGEGARRVDLNKLELKAFPASNWAKLSDWQGGSVLTDGDTKGKVVLVVTYASWMKSSLKGVEAARKLADKHKDNLVVVLVHDKTGWAEAEKPKAADGTIVRMALDTKNEFRKGILSTQDPDFFVIDRAGQLRFAAINSDVVENAVNLLVKEKTEDAAKVNDRLAEQLARAEAERRRTTGAASHIDMRRIPELPFNAPSAEAYEKAKWPVPPNLTEEERKRHKETGELPVPPNVDVPTEGWIPSTPKTTGRVMIYMLFHPELIADGRVNRVMDGVSDLQNRTRDIVFAFTVFNPTGMQWTNAPQDYKFQTDPDKLGNQIKEFLRIRKIDAPFVLDLDNNIYNAAKTQNVDKFVTGPIVITSSDGAVRWFGDGLDFFISGEAALDQILAVDPGVKARRDAERRWLEANKESAPSTPK